MHKQYGLSLVELMISITLGLILMTGVVQMFLSSRAVFGTQQGMSRIQETGRLAIDFLARDVRMAAHYGCFKPNNAVTLTNSTLNFGGLHTNFDVGIMGYSDPANLPNGAATDLGGIPRVNDPNTPQEDANILVIRSANRPGFIISAGNTPTQITAFSAVPMVQGCVDDVCVNSAMIASTCFRARLFQVSAINMAAPNLTVTHTDPWGAAVEYITGDDLLPINTTVYFLANRPPPSNAPGLWQRINNASAPIELLEGVESMRITYATGAANNAYLEAAAITLANAWQNVASVRIELVVRSLEDNVVDSPQPYTFAGDVITPADRRMRQTFSTTVGIRSRTQ